MLWLAHFPAEWVYSQKRDNKGAVCPTSPCVYTLPYLFVSRSALTPDAFNWFKVCEEMLCFHTCGFERYVLFWKDLTKSSLLPYSWIWPQLPPHLQPALCQMPNQEVCTGNSCPSHPPVSPRPGASWEKSNVWAWTCSWRCKRCRYCNQGYHELYTHSG